MNIPAIYQNLQEFSFLQSGWLVGLSVLSAFALVWVERTRFALPLWLLLTCLLSIQVSLILPAYIALAVVVVGVFSSAMFYMTARGRGAQTAVWGAINWPVLFFQVLLAIFIVLVLWGLAYQTDWRFMGNSADVTFMVTSLFALGLFRFVTTTEPLALGMGILLIVTAVGSWQAHHLQRPLAIGVWAILVLLTTLLTSYLMQHNARLAQIIQKQTETAPQAPQELA